MSNLTGRRGTCPTAVHPTPQLSGTGIFGRCEFDGTAEFPSTSKPAAAGLIGAKHPTSGDSDWLDQCAD